MNTTLLAGKVRHRRSTPSTYALEHNVWYLGLDLAELGAVFSASPLLRRNARAPMSFHDSDYLPVPGEDIAIELDAHLRANGITAARVELITGPRVMGYQFNPASFYLCREQDGTISAVVVEVHNTFGERHLYTLRGDKNSTTTFTDTMDKEFYVSPFIDEEGRYRVTVRENGDRLAIGINLRIDGQPVLATSLDLRRVPLTARNIARLAVRHPLAPHKTILAIHWHAFRLWLRGVEWHRHGGDGTRPSSALAGHR